MQGLEIAKKYYDEFGAQAIHDNFPEIEGLIAVGLAGSGSECYGFDDEISTDHDFDPGFCIWIPDEDIIDSKAEFRLERLYSKLPKEYMGLKKEFFSPAGGNRRGVIRISDFLERHIGKDNIEFTLNDWFSIPECALSEVVNGQIWRDDSGFFTEVRNKIKNMPDDVRMKKLAGSLYIMGQSGIYNFKRCIEHGEKGAAQLAVCEFVKHTIHSVFLLNNEYMPYYKWSFRALSQLNILPDIREGLEQILNTGNEKEYVGIKTEIIEFCAKSVTDELYKQGLVSKNTDDLGYCAFNINDNIKDVNIRNADILSGVSTSL